MSAWGSGHDGCLVQVSWLVAAGKVWVWLQDVCPVMSCNGDAAWWLGTTLDCCEALRVVIEASRMK